MSRTDLDAHTLARSLRRMAGDGSVEWVMEPIQADVLRDIADMLAENADLRETLKRRNRQFETMTDMWAARGAENAKLREQMERLVTLLRVDCDIEASWDGLRKFWSIELTENGCLIRDRACKAEAENAKLRELVAGIGHLLFALDVDYCATCPRDGINHPCPVYAVNGGECLYKTDLRELGVDVP